MQAIATVPLERTNRVMNGLSDRTTSLSPLTARLYLLARAGGADSEGR